MVKYRSSESQSFTPSTSRFTTCTPQHSIMNTLMILMIIFTMLFQLTTSQNDTVSSATCPLDFNILRRILNTTAASGFDEQNYCQYAVIGIRLAAAEYLRRTNSFVLSSLNMSELCWNASQQILAENYFPNFAVRQHNCGFERNWMSVSDCLNITNRQQFERSIPKEALSNVVSACNQSLDDVGSCRWCSSVLTDLQMNYFSPGDSSVRNISDCFAFSVMYVAAFINPIGTSDQGTANCLFSINLDSSKSKNIRNIIIIAITISIVLIMAILFGFWWYRRRKLKKLKGNLRPEINGVSALKSFTESTSLVKYTIDDIREATRNFAQDNIIGKGGFGNVYKGVLVNDTEVAVKRFKNCSAAADAIFRHEVEMIGSVQHVNLVALRGYCSATTPFEGYQRIIVCDLVKNGSLHDHLFGKYSSSRRLSWPIRKNIALGTARGLDYLHHGAQTTIIHRDIKASNILLDEDFEAKVADFGLAKFAPDGATHLSTRIAGTRGYIAPEYALYGQLTERSDVYSFGVVLLELLSGKKAIFGVDDGQPALLADWAWSLVRNGSPLEVIDSEMSECDPPEIMERYVLVAVLSSHPQLYARPTMDQVFKMLDTDLLVPSIPERPIMALIENAETPSSNSESGLLFTPTPTGHQANTYEMDPGSTATFEIEEEYRIGR